MRLRFGHSLVTEHATRGWAPGSSHTQWPHLHSAPDPDIVQWAVMSTGTVPRERLPPTGGQRSGLLLFVRWSCEMMCQGAVMTRRWTNHIKSRSRHECIAMSVHTHRRHQYHSASSLRHVLNTPNPTNPRTTTHSPRTLHRTSHKKEAIANRFG